MWAASPCVLGSLFAALLVTGRLQPIVRTALSAAGLSSGLQGPTILLASLALLLSSLLANTAMTSMANKAVRGDVIGVPDLFRFRGFGVTSLVLVITLVAAALGSLVFFVGALIAAGLLVGAQSTALRTGSFRASIRTSASVLRTDPIRILGLAAFLLLAVMIGVITGGLAFLVVLPVAKIIGGFADAYRDALSVTEAGTEADRASTAGLVPRPVQFHWTVDEESILRQTAPPLHLPHILAALLVVGLAIFLLFPRLPFAAEDLSSSQEPAQAASTISSPVPSTPPAPQTSVDASPPPPSTMTEPVFVDSYGNDNDPPLPCQMHWGSYIVRIEKLKTDEDPLLAPSRLTILAADGSVAFTVTDDNFSFVKKEPLLGGATPELLIHTTEGADGTHGMELALTQQGGVHNVFILDELANVTPKANDGKSEELVVDTSIDGPSSDIHHYPILTSTYRWNGYEYENADKSDPGPTEARMNTYESLILGTEPGSDGDQITTYSVGLLANAASLGHSHFSDDFIRSSPFQQGVAWLRENETSRANIKAEIAAAKKPLHAVTGDKIPSDTSEEP